MASVFSKIISKEIPCYKIAENQDFIAFLDINPNSLGHTLCVPKIEVDNFLDLEKKSYDKLMSFSRNVALAIKQVVPCKRIGMSLIGLEVPHVHVHLIPISNMEDMQFIKKIKLNHNKFDSLAKEINSVYTLSNSI
ncbi:HIT family protein [Flavobacteriaceae bacterium]|jgi:histidine triad (HIT) family protein|nr:HIT family protein [Flavobacteriaceae bacterium]